MISVFWISISLVTLPNSKTNLQVNTRLWENFWLSSKDVGMVEKHKLKGILKANPNSSFHVTGPCTCRLYHKMIFQVLKVVSAKMAAFWDVHFRFEVKVIIIKKENWIVDVWLMFRRAYLFDQGKSSTSDRILQKETLNVGKYSYNEIIMNFKYFLKCGKYWQKFWKMF